MTRVQSSMKYEQLSFRYQIPDPPQQSKASTEKRLEML